MQNQGRLWVLAFCHLILSSCLTGPEKEPKSPLNYLNGDHYQSTVKAGPVPVVIERRQASTEISGEVRQGAGLYPRPLRFEKIILLQGQQVVAQTSSDEKGTFLFTGQFADGNYTLVIESDRGRGQQSILVKGYKNSGIVIDVVSSSKNGG